MAGVSWQPSTEELKQGILPLRERKRVYNGWLRERLERLLPGLMDEAGIEMWIVVAREYNEDPVIMSLLPEPHLYARRRTILVFHRVGEGVDRLAVSRYGYEGFYEGVWDPSQEDQFQCLARLVEERAPSNIGVNVSNTFAFGDGLTHGEHGLLVEALGPHAGLLTSAEKLCVRWLETRSRGELEAYPWLVQLTHAIVREAFSSKVIVPGVTTVEDVQWWMRQRMLELGVQMWFPATVDRQAPGEGFGDKEKSKTIQRGDLLHCDVGFSYLGLCTDVQQNAYVLRHGEAQPPKGLVEALKQGNRLQDILEGEMETGRTGNQILSASLEKARQEGLNPSIYCHPIGVHGHGAGPTIGLWDHQEGVPGRGDYPLHPDTVHAIELNVKHLVEEWGGQEVRMSLEEDAWWDGDKLIYLDGRQLNLHLVK